jgi:hypothetical protein
MTDDPFGWPCARPDCRYRHPDWKPSDPVPCNLDPTQPGPPGCVIEYLASRPPSRWYSRKNYLQEVGR